MHRSHKKFDFYLFTEKDQLKCRQKRIIKECDRLNSNKLSINASKCNFVIFHPYQRKLDREVNLKIFDNNLEQLVSLQRKTYMKNLGFLTDGNARLRHLVPDATLVNISPSLIEPHISYGLVA